MKTARTSGPLLIPRSSTEVLTSVEGKLCPMADETVDQFLARRERELTAQISALHGQIAPKEAELLQIRRVKAALNLDADLSKSLTSEAELPANHHLFTTNYDAVLASVIGGRSMPPYHTMTIKELTIQALLDHFHVGGTAAGIRDFIRDAYGRAIEPASMRTQMHRLKVDSILKYDPDKDIWDFQLGKRALYDTYNHQSSRKAMPELRDNAPDDDALLRAAEKFPWTPADDEAAQESETTDPKPGAPSVRIGPLVIKRRV
jgi:hypothetical protein